jgi:hypothetical protein
VIDAGCLNQLSSLSFSSIGIGHWRLIHNDVKAAHLISSAGKMIGLVARELIQAMERFRE